MSISKIEHCPSETYIPVAATISEDFFYSMGTLPIARSEVPTQICGKARRVGRTGTSGRDIAVYRLKPKFKVGNRLMMITLPGFFVIEHGQFIPWEQWQCNQQREDGAL